jgi:signal peptidase I
MRQRFGYALRGVIVVGLVLILGRSFLLMGIFLPCRVSSGSMEPTILTGARIFVNRSAYWFRAPGRWDVVVFRCPDVPTEICVKRVAGLPGERVRISNGVLYVNDLPQEAPLGITYGPRSGRELGDSPEYTLGSAEYFVLGDNSSTSEDSRSWNPPGISEESILGHALFVPRGLKNEEFRRARTNIEPMCRIPLESTGAYTELLPGS